MSLEAAIAANTTALQVLTETLTRGGLPAPLKPVTNPNVVDGPKPPVKGAVKAAEPKPELKAAEQRKTTVKAPSDPYAPVKKAILDATAAGHRKSIKDMLAEYEVQTGADLPVESYAEVLEKIAVITSGEVELA